MRLLLPLFFLLTACPKATPEAAAPVPVAVFAMRAADAAATPEQLPQIMKEVYDQRLLIAVQGAAGGPLTLTLAPARKDGVQDLCAETTSWSGLTAAADGSFSLSDATLTLNADGDRAGLSDVDVSGRLAAEGLVLDRVSGLLQTADLVPLAGPGNPPDTVCNFLPILGPCVACPDGTATCWSVALRDIPVQLSTATVVPRAKQDICADPACASAKICR